MPYPASTEERRCPSYPVAPPVSMQDLRSDPWKAIDEVPIEDLLQSQLPVIETVPVEYVERWGTAMDHHANAMVEWAMAGRQGAEAEVDLLRRLKWLIALPRLLLRKNPSKRNRAYCKARARGEGATYNSVFHEKALKRRFVMYMSLELEALIAEWKEDATAYTASREKWAAKHRLRQTPVATERERTLTQVCKLMREGYVGRAMGILEGNGVVNAFEVEQQMLDKHPPAAEQRWDYGILDGTPPAVVDGLGSRFEKMCNKKSAGPDGLRPHHLKCTALYSFTSGAARDEAGHDRAVRSMERLYECAYDLRFPPWVNRALAAGKLTALVKKPPDVPGGRVDARPINGRSTLNRAVETELMHAAGSQLCAFFEPQQLAIGTSRGVEAVAWGIKMTLEQHMLQQEDKDEASRDVYALVAIDIKNAFNAFSRRKGMEAAVATITHGTVDGTADGEEWCPAAKTLVRAFHAMCFATPDIYASTTNGSLEVLCGSDEGGPQGSPVTGVIFALLIQSTLRKFDALPGVTVRAIADDITVCLKADEHTASILNELCSDLREACGCEVSRAKCGYYCPTGDPDAVRDLMPDWLNPSYSNEGHPGIVVVGVPMGSKRFVRGWIKQEAESIAAQILQSARELGQTDAHAAWLALRQSFQTRFSYILATNFPRDTEEAAGVVDRALRTALVDVTGFDLWADDKEADWKEFTSARARLPTRHGGCGIYKASELTHTSFLNSINGCIKLFLRVGGADGDGDQVGLFDNLRPSFIDASAIEDPAAFAPGGRRTEAMEGWLERAHPGSVAEAYREAWSSIVKVGKEEDMAHLLGPDDMKGVLDRHGLKGDALPDGCEGFFPNGCPRNPYTWKVHQVIDGPDKLQRLLRHTRAWAQRKWMLMGVAVARSGSWGAAYFREAATGLVPVMRDKLSALIGSMSTDDARQDARFISFLNVDEFSRVPLETTQWATPFNSVAFREYIALYMGLPSPACRTFVGERLERGRNKSFHVVVDPEGLKLNTAANGTGGLRTKQHDDMQDALIIETARAGIRTQVKHAIGIDEASRTTTPPWNRPARPESEVPRGTGTRIIPDFIVDFGTTAGVPRELRKDPGVDPQRTEVLADVKTLGFPKGAKYLSVETYTNSWARIATREASPAVAKRADAVHGEYLSAAKKLDQRWLTKDEMAGGSKGPFVHTVESFGKTAGFAVGAFGELSGEWSAMAAHIAQKRARVVKTQTGIARSESELTGRIKREIVCHWGSKSAYGNVLVRLLIARERASLHVASRKRRSDRYSDYAIQKALERARYEREGANTPFMGVGFSALGRGGLRGHE